MRRLFAITVVAATMICGSLKSNAQGMAVNTSGSAANSSAMLDVSSTTQGVLVPRMTSAQRTIISSPATGLLVYQTDGTAGFYFYNGSAWTSLSGGAPTGSAGGDLTGTYPNPTVANSSITSAKILDGTITNSDVSATAAIDYSKLNLAGSVATTDISGTGATSGQVLGYNGTNVNWTTPSGGGSGTVSSVSSNNLSPIFTTSVSNATTTPTISYSLSNAAPFSVLTNSTSATSTPVYGKVHPAALLNLGGTPSSTTFYRGDGQWVTPTSSGSNTNMNWQPATGGNAISFTSGVYGSLTSTSGSTTAPYPFNSTSQAYDICPVACTLDAFAMSGNCRVTGTGATNFTATVMKNGSATSLAVTINVPNGATVGQALSPVLVTGSVSVSAGDILYLQWTNDNSAGPGPDLGWSIHAH